MKPNFYEKTRALNEIKDFNKKNNNLITENNENKSKEPIIFKVDESKLTPLHIESECNKMIDKANKLHISKLDKANSTMILNQMNKNRCIGNKNIQHMRKEKIGRW